jgi:hypothetical protein
LISARRVRRSTAVAFTRLTVSETALWLMADDV